MRPSPTSYPPYFNTYIKLVDGEDINALIAHVSPEQIHFFESVHEEESLYKYAEEKWTIKEILQHVIDAERIFCYRALAIARGEKGVIPGFDENGYARNSHANNRTWNALVEEFKAVRNASILLVKSMNEADFDKSGSVNDYSISVRAILFVIAGHSQHHIHIIRERYLDI